MGDNGHNQQNPQVGCGGGCSGRSSGQGGQDGGGQGGVPAAAGPQDIQAITTMIAATVKAANIGAQPTADHRLGIALDILAVIMDKSTKGKANKPILMTHIVGIHGSGNR